MEVCKELKKLSKEFHKRGYKLYIVGGYVRDSLMNIQSQDIDITSNMPVEEVQEICKILNFSTTNINKKLGTILIKNKDAHFEYTRFRCESYTISGSHTPDSITFIDNLETDCLRRDFTINSIYYDIDEDKIIDPVNGQEDISKKAIRTTRNPDFTLSDDGLRILRAIRFSSTLDFNIDKKTMQGLKTFVPLLNKISKERILKELENIVIADYKLDRPNHRFLKFCNQIDLIKYIFNSTLENTKKFSKEDIQNFYKLPTDSRLIGFYILVLKNFFNGYLQNNQLSYNINAILGINGIKDSTSHIFTTEKIYRVYQNIVYNVDLLNATINYLTFSDAERAIIDVYLDKNAKNTLDSTISAIKKYNLPLSIHDLKITASDLIELGIDRKFISKILSILFNQVLQMSVKNDNSDLKNLALEIHNTFKNL